MARYSADHAKQTRSKIVSEASRQIREQGMNGASVGSVMSGCGLTNGGFYAHFGSKSDLVAEAVGDAMKERAGKLAGLVDVAAGNGTPEFIPQMYLSREHVDTVGGGCYVAALVSEMHRQPEQVRAAFEKGLKGMASLLAGPDKEGGWARAAMLAGAMAIIRSLDDEAARDAVRREVESAFKQLHRATPSTE